jgi:hypothetical protein
MITGKFRMSDVKGEPSSGPTYHGLGNMDWSYNKGVAAGTVPSISAADAKKGGSDAAISLNHSTTGHVMGNGIESYSATMNDKK